MAESFVGDYIAKLSSTTFGRDLGERALVSNKLSGADLDALKADIMNKLTNDGLIASKEADLIVQSMMAGVAIGVKNLAAGSLANDYKTGSVLISVAIKSSVQSLVAHPAEISSSTVKLSDVVGDIMKSGVTSLSTMSSADVASVQKAIHQSVQDVVAATSSIKAEPSMDFVKAAVTATIQVAISSQSEEARNLMQSAFAGASAALGDGDATKTADLQDIVADSIKKSASSSLEAEAILVQAAIGLSSSDSLSTSSSHEDIAQIIQAAAQSSSGALSLSIDATAATAAAVEVAPTASLTASIGTSGILPFLAEGYLVTLDPAGSTMSGTVLSLSCSGVDTSSFAGAAWTVRLYSGTYAFTLKVKNVDGQKSDYASQTIHIDLPSTAIKVSSLSLSPGVLGLSAGGAAATLTSLVLPQDATNKAVAWASSDNSIATVDAFGLVSPIKAGNATITATTVDGSKKATCAVTVAAAIVPVSGVRVTPSTLTLVAGDAGETLAATVSPDGATNKSVSWASGSPSVATVDKAGLVRPLKAGTALITATTIDGKRTASCELTVLDAGQVPGTVVIEPPVAYEVAIVGPASLDAASTANATYSSSFTGSASAYRWRLDGIDLPANTSSGLELALSGIAAGKHILSLDVTALYQSSIAYSGTLDIWVVK